MSNSIHQTSAKKSAPRKSVLALARNLASISLMLAVFCVLQSRSVAAAEHATSASTGQETSVPFGWVDFCQRYRGECDGSRAPAQDVALNAKSLREIDRINRWVNRHIESVTDMEHWGVVDQWDYPTDGKGDCEDMALLKRKLLADQGFPIQALLMTVVKDKNGDGHAILTVKTNNGDYILDNLSDEVKPWNKTGYRFVKRQSQTDANSWVSILAPNENIYVSR